MAGLGGLIGGGLGYLVGGPAGAGVGAAIGGGIDTNNQAAANADAANTFSAQQYATRWQTTVKDMEAAGLNPMLAYSQGVGNAPTGQMAPVTNPYINSSQNYASAANLSEQGEVLRSQASLNVEQARVVNATVDKVRSETRNLDTDNERLKAVILNLEETRQNLIKDGYNLTAQYNVLNATFNKIRAEIPQINQLTLSGNANEVLTRVETELKQLDLDAARKFDNFGREFKQYEPIIDLIKSIFGRRGGGITINR